MSDKELPESLKGTLTVAKAAADVAALAFPPAALMHVAVDLFESILQHARERREREAQAWLAEVLWQSGDDAANAVEIEAKIRSSEEAQDAILAELKRILEGVDRRVHPALALLTRAVVQGRAKADAFFRGFSRTLADLSAEEYEILRDMIRLGLERVPTDPVLLMLAVTRDPETGAEQWTVDAHEVETAVGAYPGERSIIKGHSSVARRLFSLLEVNGLATTDIGVAQSAAGRPNGISIDRDVAQRMADCMVR
jgi:hypothetical protein